MGSAPIQEAVSLANLLKRPELKGDSLREVDKDWCKINARVARQVEIQIKYDGYIKKQLQEIERLKELAKIKIPSGLDYEKVPGLSNEIRGKLKDIKPHSLAQASRIAGITPAALSLLMVFLKGRRGRSPKT